jgi:hypothetical protein
MKIKKEVSATKKENVEFDNYVPISVSFENNTTTPPLYLRYGNGKSSLLEIGVSESSGEIISVTLVCFSAEIKNQFKGSSIYVYRCSGCPVFEVSSLSGGEKFANRFFDDFSKDFEVFIEANSCRLIFSVVSSVDREIVNGDISFGVSLDDELAYIDINNLTDIETNILLDSKG